MDFRYTQHVRSCLVAVYHLPPADDYGRGIRRKMPECDALHIQLIQIVANDYVFEDGSCKNPDRRETKKVQALDPIPEFLAILRKTTVSSSPPGKLPHQNSGAERKDPTMTEATIGLEEMEQEFLFSELSDETLEAAGDTTTAGAANYTFANCSGLSVCPA
jgi:hypothetical protein